jgi:hypothetical protein
MPDGFRRARDVLESLWAGTVERARALPPELLHERVGGEWSFVETLRHLLFATDIWVGRAILRDRRPWHPLSLPFDEMPPQNDQGAISAGQSPASVTPPGSGLLLGQPGGVVRG